MHGEITEPLDWFAGDATQDALTVPDWFAGEDDIADDWGNGAPTQPALSIDSAVLAGLMLPPIQPAAEGTRRAMGVYLCATVACSALLFGMFFVFGGRFQPASLRSHQTAPIMAASSLAGQASMMQTLRLLPIDTPHHTQTVPTTPPKPPQDKPHPSNGSTLWPTDTPPPTVTPPPTATTVPPTPTDVPPAPTPPPASLWDSAP